MEVIYNAKKFEQINVTSQLQKIGINEMSVTDCEMRVR